MRVGLHDAVVRHAGETVAKHFFGIHFVVGDTWWYVKAQNIQHYPPHSSTKGLSDIKDAFIFLVSMIFFSGSKVFCLTIMIFLLQF